MGFVDNYKCGQRGHVKCLRGKRRCPCGSDGNHVDILSYELHQWPESMDNFESGRL